MNGFTNVSKSKKNLWWKFDPLAVFALLGILNSSYHVYGVHKKHKMGENRLLCYPIFCPMVDQWFCFFFAGFSWSIRSQAFKIGPLAIFGRLKRLDGSDYAVKKSFSIGLNVFGNIPTYVMNQLLILGPTAIFCTVKITNGSDLHS